jgi:outer membrane protein OmpA-like peptidoglycan-associated protein
MDNKIMQKQDCGCAKLSGGGTSGHHPQSEAPDFVAGTTTDSEFNTYKAGLVAVACWKVDDIRFHFGSSFVAPDMLEELAELKELTTTHTTWSKAEDGVGCSLAIFGHADPVGDEAFNKSLSGRRATAIYALLTRNTALWEKLYATPLGNDNWGEHSLQVMLASLGRGQTALHAISQNATERQALFKDYMDKLCGADLHLQARDFLAGGSHAHGKGDYQGCGKFNPLLIFSKHEQQQYNNHSDHTERNIRNAPNRRVMILIFRKGTRVEPDKWPCPSVEESAAACKKRFWSDADRRLHTQLDNERRLFQKSRDTFACRFYDRLVQDSPCEHGNDQYARKYFIYLPETLRNKARLLVTDEDGQQIMELPASAAAQDAQNNCVFDLSSLDASKSYRLQCMAGKKCILAVMTTDLSVLHGFAANRDASAIQNMTAFTGGQSPTQS